MTINKEKVLSDVQKYIIKGQPKRAIKEYLDLIEASPKDKRLYLKLGDLYFKIGEKENAIKKYLKLADLFVEEDLNFRAISIYKRILSIEPKSLEPFNKIAQLYLKEGFIGSAKTYYQNILKIRPNHEEALEALKKIETLQKTQKSQKLILSPDSVLPKHLLPHEKESLEMEFHPLRFPSQKEESFPIDKDLEMHYHLGIAYKEMGLYDEAIFEFELAAADASMKPDSYAMLGSCYRETGDYDRSIEFYKKAIQQKGLPDKKMALLQFHLGLAFEAKGMIPEALSTYALVLHLDHSFLEAHEKIKQLRKK